MSWQPNPITIKLHTFTGDLGLTRTVGKLLQRGGCEQAFDDAIFAEIGIGNVVWYVGANIR